MALASVRRRVAAYGRPPPDLDERRAFAELLASRSLYGQEPANLADYSFELLKVARGSVRPRRPDEHLPPDARGYIRRFQTAIEMSTEEIDSKFAREPPPLLTGIRPFGVTLQSGAALSSRSPVWAWSASGGASKLAAGCSS